MFFLLSTNSYSTTLQWGESTQIGISKKEINQIINQYIDKNYPDKVKAYYEELREIKLQKLNKYSGVTFVSDELMWQDTKDNVNLKYSSLEAKIYCKKLYLASKHDWRLPNYSELLSLINYYRFEPATLNNLDYVSSSKYWSISLSISDYSANWYVDFNYGETGVDLRSNKNNVRCVRDISKEPGEI